MRKLFRGAKKSKEVIPLLNNISFGALLSALHKLDEEATILDIYGEAIAQVLTLTPSIALQELASKAIDEVVKKQQEVSDLEDIFNAPSFNKDNN